jgi:hypothetical protein
VSYLEISLILGKNTFPADQGLGVYAMFTTILAVLMICSSVCLHWVRANALVVWGLDWNPFQWWLYTGLVTTYLALYARYMLVNHMSVWQITLLFSITSLATELLLNTIFFGANPKMYVAISLVGMAMVVSK